MAKCYDLIIHPNGDPAAFQKTKICLGQSTKDLHISISAYAINMDMYITQAQGKRNEKITFKRKKRKSEVKK